VQIVYSSSRGSRDIEHIGSAHDEVELELLETAARQRLAAGQGVLDLGLDTGAPGGPLPITSSRMGCLLEALQRAYQVLGLDLATGSDEVFYQLVAARMIEPVSKLDSLRAPRTSGWARPAWCCTTARPCTSRPTLATGSGRAGSPRSGGWNRRSPSAGWSIRKFVKTARRYRTVQIQAGNHIITAADPLPADLRDAIEAINADRSQGG
jgi:hypothetical protein